MFCHFKSLIFLVLLIASGCGQEMSLEPRTIPPLDTTGTGTSGGTAEFELVTFGEKCSNVTAVGNVQVGKVLGADAQISVTVNVIKTGAWKLSTNTRNGIVFMGAGTFTTTGIQMLTLQGEGTPLTAGLNTFTVKSCSVEVATTPEYYYKITFNGKTYEEMVSGTNNYEAGSFRSGGDNVTLSANIEIGQGDIPKGKTGFGVIIGTMHNYMNATNADFKVFFAPRNLIVRKSFADGDGVILEWQDENGDEWSTTYGTGDQTNSYFQILSIIDATDLTGTLYLKTKMRFSCKLYNRITGAMILVTNGEMAGLFGKI